jgi:hypothetical protein
MRKVLLLALVLATSSCESWLSPGTEWVEWPALIAVTQEQPAIDAPETAARGASFNVGFSTVATHGCIEHARNSLVVEGLDVHIYSWQRERVNAVACTQAVTVEDHVVPVTVSVVGTATIHLHGRNISGDQIVLTRAVTVTP